MIRLMPAETARHERTWMAFPPGGYVLGSSPKDRREGILAWSTVANAINPYEPVSMLVDPEMMSDARRYLDSSITVHPFALNDCWMRDSGPTFVWKIDDGSGVPSHRRTLEVIDWVFNGWGAQQWAQWNRDALVGREVARLVHVPVVHSPLVLEGGGFHVDGEGTALMTETVALDPARNPGVTREIVEAELERTLGVRKVVWLPRGLARDYATFGTRGHVDILACLPRPGLALVHEQRNPDHPDYAVSRRTIAILSRARDARGRQFTVVPIPAPAQGFGDEGEPNDYSYVNHYVANGAVFACVFGDAYDERALATLAQVYPNRRIIPIQATALFARGGGIHCITQQQPAI